MMILVFNLLETSKPDEEMVFSDFTAKLQQGEVAEVTIKQPENLMMLLSVLFSFPLKKLWVRVWKSPVMEISKTRSGG